MQLNLPFLDRLANSKQILIAGAGGGFDIFSGLPIYFALRDIGKSVHLANYSFSDFGLVEVVSQPERLANGLVLGAHGAINHALPYYPEGYLSRWFDEVRGDDVTVWMFNRTGVEPLAKGYRALVDHLKIDTLILIDGGVDLIMRGDEVGSGTMVEDFDHPGRRQPDRPARENSGLCRFWHRGGRSPVPLQRAGEYGRAGESRRVPGRLCPDAADGGLSVVRGCQPLCLGAARARPQPHQHPHHSGGKR